jgi:hypothetical protein
MSAVQTEGVDVADLNGATVSDAAVAQHWPRDFG